MLLALKILATILFFTGILEIVGLGYYIAALSESDNNACCGILSHTAGSIDGAVCDTDDITGTAIDRTTDDDGNVWCTVAGTVCDTKALGNSTITLSQCFNESGHNISSMCSAEALDVQANTANTVPIIISAVLLFLLMWSTAFSLMSYCGCCKRYQRMKDKAVSAKCFDSKDCYMRLMLVNVIFAALFWYALFLANYFWVDSILDNGYALKTLDTVSAVVHGDWTLEEIADDVDAVCEIDGFSWTEGFIWVNYNMDVDPYVRSVTYEGLMAIALICSTLQLVLMIRVNYCLKGDLWEYDQEKERQKKERTDTASTDMA